MLYRKWLVISHQIQNNTSLAQGKLQLNNQYYLMFNNTSKFGVTECFRKYGSLILKFTLSFKSSTLTKTSHYSGYQQNLFDEVKRLKEVEGLGYRRISYLIYEKGYRGIRSNSVLRNNDIYSIYKKGKIRKKRINRKFKTIVKDIMIYESRWFLLII